MLKYLKDYRIWMVAVVLCLIFRARNQPVTLAPSLKVTSPVVTAIPTVAVNRLPDVFRSDFLEGCIGEEASFAYCECTLEYLERNYTNNEILRMAINLEQDGELPNALLNAAKACSGFSI
jgi:hypothetical protein